MMWSQFLEQGHHFPPPRLRTGAQALLPQIPISHARSSSSRFQPQREHCLLGKRSLAYLGHFWVSTRWSRHTLQSTLYPNFLFLGSLPHPPCVTRTEQLDLCLRGQRHVVAHVSGMCLLNRTHDSQASGSVLLLPRVWQMGHEGLRPSGKKLQVGWGSRRASLFCAHNLKLKLFSQDNLRQ